MASPTTRKVAGKPRVPIAAVGVDGQDERTDDVTDGTNSHRRLPCLCTTSWYVLARPKPLKEAQNL